MRFSWDTEKAAENAGKHGVTFEEAAEIFLDPQLIEDFDTEHSDDEARYVAIGLSSRRLLVVVYTQPQSDTIRLISARKAGRVARSKYEDS